MERHYMHMFVTMSEYRLHGCCTSEYIAACIHYSRTCIYIHISHIWLKVFFHRSSTHQPNSGSAVGARPACTVVLIFRPLEPLPRVRAENRMARKHVLCLDIARQRHFQSRSTALHTHTLDSLKSSLNKKKQIVRRWSWRSLMVFLMMCSLRSLKENMELHSYNSTSIGCQLAA